VVRSFVRSWWSSFFMYLHYCSTDWFVVYMCRCAVNKTPGRPRAQEGTRTTGTTRALIHGHLKAAHWGAKNTHLQLCSKHIAPKPCVAWAPELVLYICSTRIFAHVEWTWTDWWVVVQKMPTNRPLLYSTRRAIPHTDPILWTTVVNVYREILP